MIIKVSKIKKVLLSLCFITSTIAFAQVGIGTETPDPSSILHIQSNSKGLLAPRMTTTERNAIVSLAESLLVYDTTEQAFYFYLSSTSEWIRLSDSNTVMRTNFKLIQSAADLSSELTAGGGSKYLLSSNTLYEVNGTILLPNPIELNNAMIQGVNTNEDKLIKTSGGTIFTGNTGGTIKQLTLVNTGGSIFNLTGSITENLFIRTLIIANSASVGTISGYNSVLMNLIQYAGNTAGITFSNLNDLLLSDIGWLNTNSGTYETYSGTFNLIEKQGGFMAINSTATGIDVSSNPTVSSGVISGVSFSGSSTQYVNKYTTGSFPNYNFTKEWTVACPGLRSESDEFASANIYYNGTITTGFVQTTNDNNPFNLTGDLNGNLTTAVNLLRTTSTENNRITYSGKKSRNFQLNASLSVRGNSGIGDFYAFFIRKNGTTSLIETNTLMRVNNTTDISSNAITGTVEMAPDDYIEIWAQRLTGNGSTSITVFSLNFNIN